MKKLFGALVKLFSLLAVLGALLYAAVLTIPREIPPDQYAVLVREFLFMNF